MKITLSWWLLMMLTYSMVSGGAFGLEEMIQSAGYGLSILILIILPCFWSAPVGLLVAEQGGAMPAEGGFYIWTRRALGPFWGFQHAWLAMAASVFDMGIYCNLFAGYVLSLFPSIDADTWRTPLGLIVVLIGVLTNVFGARSVGRSSQWAVYALWAPFVILIVLVVAHRLIAGEPPVVSASAVPLSMWDGIMVAMWNLMGWDNASTVAGEVERPQRTYLVVMVGTIALVTFTYLAPVAAMAITGEPHQNWQAGYWVTMAYKYGGWTLALAMTLAGMASSQTAFSSLVMSYTRLVATVAQEGWFPKFLAKKNPKNGAPVAAILCCSLLWAFSVTLGFKKLILVDLMFYGLTLVIAFVAIIVLRIREPEPYLQRPFKIPGGIPFLVVMALPPTFLVVGAIYHNRSEHVLGMSALVLGALVVVLGIAVYFLRRHRVPKWEGE
jgi:amino acid transporter